MPRRGRRAGPAGHEPAYEYRGHWIDHVRGSNGEPASDKYYAFWYDPIAGRTQRRSLRTTDLETAIDALTLLIQKKSQKTSASYLAIVLETYFSEVTDPKPSGATARNAGRWILQGISELKNAVDPAKAKVADLTAARQLELIQILNERHKHSVAYIARNMGVLNAALKYAKLPDAPEVLYNQNKIAEQLELPDPVPRNWIPTMDELATFIDNLASENAFRWTLIALNTACRPAAGLELSPFQRDTRFGLLSLNPKGRRQNKKYRATVKETECLAGWLNHWGGDDRYCRGLTTTDGLQSAYNRARVLPKVSLPQMTPYAIRHMVATVLRSARVPGDQMQLFMGHRSADTKISDSYGQFDADYLCDAAEAIDAFMRELNRRTERDLFAPKNTQKTRKPENVITFRKKANST